MTDVVSHFILFVLGGLATIAVLACAVLYAVREKLYP